MTAALTTTWPQVLAWRLGRHLLDPLGKADAADVVRRLCGVQAQVPSAAAQAIALRQDGAILPSVDQALRDRELMRTWAMRGTLHLLAPEEAGAYLALAGAHRSWEKPSWQRAFGVSIADLAALTEAVGAALDGRELTREELVHAVAEQLGHRELEEQLSSGWGAVLKPVAAQGLLCQATSSVPNRVCFARPDQWLPGWTGIPSPEAAAAVVIPAYLRAYGPASMESFDAWLSRSNTKKGQLRGWFGAVEDQLATVDVEGRLLLALAEDVDALAAAVPTGVVRLVAGFDQWVLGPGTAATEIIPTAHRPDVSRSAGWISPVVLAGGVVAGVWEAPGGHVRVRLFDDGPTIDAKGLAAEVERAGEVLGLLAQNGGG